MATPSVTRSGLDQGLAELRDDLLRISSLAEDLIARSVSALKRQDLEAARALIEMDTRVNTLRYQVETRAVQLIALQQPAARDLRFIMAAVHSAIEMERMADHACGIARICLRIGEEPLIKPLIDIPKMCDIACAMLHDATSAFIALDAEAARHIAERDSEVDNLYAQVLRELLTYMMQDRRKVEQGTYLLWVAHNLERIADRVTNVCERIIFVATGELGDYKANDPSTTAAQ
ncbi:MAG: phosphate signaling complex protein PhoU [Thermoflexales bacterium]|nr:phosphate signaling complex protein PhoU [Thermoflexales bacterium]MCS7323906.1 phosphate signaling complex protein PhoU [Thermoflexales bacterium]MDW8053750.1 phosphate signaling complex protein PhoU [Anaerolineae bacterium]MDW8292994.1 phosphate signaling complex protein PhoU [Anaerolineae bacterium]